MSAEGAGGSKLTQTMADHIFRDVDRNMAASIVDGNRVSNHLREDHAGAAPGANHFLFAFLVHRLDALQQLRLNKRTFFQGTRHIYLCLSAPSDSSYCGGAQCTDRSS